MSYSNYIIFVIEWLSPMPDDNSKAYCQFCRWCGVHFIKVQPHKKDIQKHGQTKKHLEAFKYSQDLTSKKKITDFSMKITSDTRKTIELKIFVFITEHCSHIQSIIWEV